MTANVWSPNPNTVTQANAQGLVKLELQNAKDGQRVFALSSFAYAPNTGSMLVFKNGQILTRSLQYLEVDAATVLLTDGCHAGDSVVFVGFVGVTGTAGVDAQLRSDLGNAGGANLVKFMQSNDALVQSIQARVAEMLSITSYGSDDTGAANTANSSAFTLAATKGKSIHVPKPATSYYLATDPVIPDNVNIFGSPDWFSGPGKLPVHKFIAISEGVDPRIFATKNLNYTETEVNETKRKWAVVGWVNYKNSPAVGSTGTVTDAVGVDGRAVVDAFNGRGWGLLGLAHLTAKTFNAGSFGVSQAYACELDVNNNSGVDVNGFDGVGNTPITRGNAVVSGGSNRPGEALYVLATNRPADGSAGDNRWWAGLRFYRDSVHQNGYLIHVDDENQAIFARIPISSAGLRWTSYEAINFVEYQDKISKRRILWSQTAGYGYDIVDNAGNFVLSTYDGRVQFNRKVTLPAKIEASADQLDVSVGNTFVLTSNITINGFTGGSDGQEITIVNVSGANLTINRTANVRTPGGAAIVLNNTGTAKFFYGSPTWFCVSVITNNA